MLQKYPIQSYAIIVALVGVFFTSVSHAQGIFGNNSSSSTNQSSNQSNTTNTNTTNNTMIDSSQNISNTNTTDNSSIMNIESSTDTYNVDNSQVTDQAGPRWVQDIDWAACVQQRFNDGESFMASRRACK